MLKNLKLITKIYQNWQNIFWNFWSTTLSWHKLWKIEEIQRSCKLLVNTIENLEFWDFLLHIFNKFKSPKSYIFNKSPKECLRVFLTIWSLSVAAERRQNFRQIWTGSFCGLKWAAVNFYRLTGSGPAPGKQRIDSFQSPWDVWPFLIIA